MRAHRTALQVALEQLLLHGTERVRARGWSANSSVLAWHRHGVVSTLATRRVQGFVPSIETVRCWMTIQHIRHSRSFQVLLRHFLLTVLPDYWRCCSWLKKSNHCKSNGGMHFAIWCMCWDIVGVHQPRRCCHPACTSLHCKDSKCTGSNSECCEPTIVGAANVCGRTG